MHQDVLSLNGFYNFQKLTEKPRKNYKSFQLKDFPLESPKVEIKISTSSSKKCRRFGNERDKNKSKNRKNMDKIKEINNNQVNGFKHDLLYIVFCL